MNFWLEEINKPLFVTENRRTKNKEKKERQNINKGK
jgi:hypothetical protein